jgi:flagellar protein FlaG
MKITSSLAGMEPGEKVVTPSVPIANSAVAAIKVESNSATVVPPQYTNISDLKLAELQGTHITVSDEQLVKAIERAIKAMQGKATNLEFSVHEQTKLIAVKVKDSETGEVIREIPPEKSLDFVAKLWEMAGIFIDEKR